MTLTNEITNLIETFDFSFNFRAGNIIKRAAYALSAPLACTAATIDTVVGLMQTTPTIATLGMDDNIAKSSRDYLLSSASILQMPYYSLLRSINPNVHIDVSEIRKDSILHPMVTSPILRKSIQLQSSRSFFHREISTRLFLAVYALASVVTRVADGAIGVLAATLSFLTLGKFNKINVIAYRSLKAPALIYDICFSAVKIINPRTTFS